ncbi:sugar ABC transporter substrate-binding protein [Verrucomicrobiaceae bacterium R5-34]|uniref:Sugar ABC transporter substrate-binding protein n=1 Tax=Oceaniferula flava TaxID=2800421 RepID=A0AAE2V928_9BACT|nr:sugar ABC transporter substrate-binding protein [Oceaniferula flavus]MBK1829788.1 sugar ABC transporter substrate-binding protein [Verrucomicrobiaceae bacterium R5-34]MBK1856407.1 sugar ABC transporter substrate-binding protein [Oceaniferula flavus]MBM1137714.1 sugar ABC transporter substrate-binding protein [Oceaniferula flavus]
MKKKLIGLLAIAAMLVSVGCNRNQDGDQIKIGMTVQDLSNPTWSGYCQAIQKEAEANGAKMNYVACESNVSKQIMQIENFVSRGMDVIIVHPADPEGIEAACKEARAAGVKVIAWDDDLKNADVRWLIDNYDLGYQVGKEAADFIKEKHGGKTEVAILNYPQLPVLLARGKGIRDAITKLAPDATIVAETSAINPKEGISKMETIFQSHPNVKVVTAIGGGGSVGANEAAKAAGKITDDFGIFAVDATKPELSAIKNNEGVRMSVIVTGTDQDVATTVFGFVQKLAAGEELPAKIFRKLIPVTKDNVDQYSK